MRITVFDATSRIGFRIVKEALRRGHQVTAVSRGPAPIQLTHAGLTAGTGNSSNIHDIERQSASADVVINAVQPVAGAEDELVSSAKAHIAAVRGTNKRLVLIGGASALSLSGAANSVELEGHDFVPLGALAIAHASKRQYQVCVDTPDVDWTYAYPPELLYPGDRTGIFRLGTETPVGGTETKPSISIEDFAVAILDEVEQQGFIQRRFTAAY